MHSLRHWRGGGIFRRNKLCRVYGGKLPGGHRIRHLRQMLCRLFLYLSRKQRIDRLFVPVRPRHVLQRRGDRLRQLRRGHLRSVGCLFFLHFLRPRRIFGNVWSIELDDVRCLHCGSSVGGFGGNVVGDVRGVPGGDLCWSWSCFLRGLRGGDVLGEHGGDLVRGVRKLRGGRVVGGGLLGVDGLFLVRGGLLPGPFGVHTMPRGDLLGDGGSDGLC